jgi:biopolymer transport protein ExbD
MSDNGDLSLNVKDSVKVPGKFSSMKIRGVDGKSNMTDLSQAVQQLKTLDPSLKMVLIQPRPSNDYEEIIDVMDQFKKDGLTDLGVVPL